MTGDPAEFDNFASFYKACVVFDNFKYQIHFNFDAIEGFQAWNWIWKDDKLRARFTKL